MGLVLTDMKIFKTIIDFFNTQSYATFVTLVKPLQFGNWHLISGSRVTGHTYFVVLLEVEAFKLVLFLLGPNFLLHTWPSTCMGTCLYFTQALYHLCSKTCLFQYFGILIWILFKDSFVSLINLALNLKRPIRLSERSIFYTFKYWEKIFSLWN